MRDSTQWSLNQAQRHRPGIQSVPVATTHMGIAMVREKKLQVAGASAYAY